MSWAGRAGRGQSAPRAWEERPCPVPSAPLGSPGEGAVGARLTGLGRVPHCTSAACRRAGSGGHSVFRPRAPPVARCSARFASAHLGAAGAQPQLSTEGAPHLNCPAPQHKLTPTLLVTPRASPPGLHLWPWRGSRVCRLWGRWPGPWLLSWEALGSSLGLSEPQRLCL